MVRKFGQDPSHLSLTMPMPGYSFVIPDEKATILSAPWGQFVVYKLALDVGLRFPLHDFVEIVLRHYNIDHNQLVPNACHNILTFIAICELRDLTLSLPTFTHIHYVYKAPMTMDGAWFSICNRAGFITAWDKPSKMHEWKADFIFVWDPKKDIVGDTATIAGHR